MVANRATEGFEDGVIATLAMTIPMMVATIAGKSPMPEPFPKAVVERVVGEDASKLVVLPLTVVSHLFYGGANGAVLASFGGPMTVRKGLAWGVGLWGLMGTAFMPFVGWGVFGRKLHEGRKASVMALALHLVYGGTSGLLLKRNQRERVGARDEPAPAADEPREQAREESLVAVNVEW